MYIRLESGADSPPLMLPQGEPPIYASTNYPPIKWTHKLIIGQYLSAHGLIVKGRLTWTIICMAFHGLASVSTAPS